MVQTGILLPYPTSLMFRTGILLPYPTSLIPNTGILLPKETDQTLTDTYPEYNTSHTTKHITEDCTAHNCVRQQDNIRSLHDQWESPVLTEALIWASKLRDQVV